MFVIYMAVLDNLILLYRNFKSQIFHALLQLLLESFPNKKSFVFDMK